MTKLPHWDPPERAWNAGEVLTRAGLPILLVYSVVSATAAVWAGQLVGKVIALALGERTMFGAILQVIAMVAIVGIAGMRAYPIIVGLRRWWRLARSRGR